MYNEEYDAFEIHDEFDEHEVAEVMMPPFPQFQEYSDQLFFDRVMLLRFIESIPSHPKRPPFKPPFVILHTGEVC